MITPPHEIQTPAYVYDLRLLRQTLSAVNSHRGDIHVHYALKANTDPVLLSDIVAAGLGADCVSGGEIEAAVRAGFRPADIVFAGVGKTDDEIRTALRHGIGMFNVESGQELQVIDRLAADAGVTADVALRINPHIDAHTDAKITTGTARNKFGIDINRIDDAVDMALSLPHISLCGLHMHIGSQMTDMQPVADLCRTASELAGRLSRRGISLQSINLGGGLGVDYDDPAGHPIPRFGEYFGTIRRNLRVPPEMHVHVELGRSIVAQCGELLTRVLYVKEGDSVTFAVVDAGMNNLMRPAIYGARHLITPAGNSDGVRPTLLYDVVGPVCESSDTFATDVPLPRLHRGDMLSIHSVGAYGQSMASHYNLRSDAAVYHIEKSINGKSNIND